MEVANSGCKNQLCFEWESTYSKESLMQVYQKNGDFLKIGLFLFIAISKFLLVLFNSLQDESMGK